MLSKSGEDITLLQVYEAIEGPLEETSCLLSAPICGGDCILGDLLQSIDSQAREYLGQRTVSEMAKKIFS